MKKIIKLILNNFISILFLIIIFGAFLKSIINTQFDFKNIERNLVIAKNQLEEQFSDNFAFKKELSSIDNNTRYFVSKKSTSTQGLVGKQGWFFYKSETDGDSINDYLGTNLLTDEELLKIKDNLLTQENKLNELGIRFVIMILPNKEQVYSRYMPDEIGKKAEKSRTDLIIEYLQSNTDLEIVYPKNELISNINDHQIYYKCDTHWNELGAYIGEQQLLFQLYGEKRPPLDYYKINAKSTTLTDLANTASLAWTCKTKDDYIIENYGKNMSKYDDTILFVGDSFRTSLTPYLTLDFPNINIIHLFDYSMDLLFDMNPNIIILELVERYSDRLEIQQFIW